MKLTLKTRAGEGAAPTYGGVDRGEVCLPLTVTVKGLTIPLHVTVWTHGLLDDIGSIIKRNEAQLLALRSGLLDEVEIE